MWACCNAQCTPGASSTWADTTPEPGEATDMHCRGKNWCILKSSFITKLQGLRAAWKQCVLREAFNSQWVVGMASPRHLGCCGEILERDSAIFQQLLCYRCRMWCRAHYIDGTAAKFTGICFRQPWKKTWHLSPVLCPTDISHSVVSRPEKQQFQHIPMTGQKPHGHCYVFAGRQVTSRKAMCQKQGLWCAGVFHQLNLLVGFSFFIFAEWEAPATASGTASPLLQTQCLWCKAKPSQAWSRPTYSNDHMAPSPVSTVLCSTPNPAMLLGAAA